MYKKNQKSAIFSLILLLGSITAIILDTNFMVLSNDFQPLSDNDKTLLKTSATFTDIEIDALDTTNTSYSGNWTWAKSIGLCTGSGTSG
ncbi:MAG: hypothetical protein ACFFFT_11485, partial [Candidatus Thorarchaeota archaeon]